MNFKNDVMFYLSKGKIYNGVNLYENEEDVCPKCGEAKCKCSNNTEKDEWLKKIKEGKKKGAAPEDLHTKDGLAGETTDEEKEMLKWAKSKVNASKSTGTKGGDDGDDNNASVETDEEASCKTKFPGKFKKVTRSKNSEEDVKEPKDPFGTGRNSCDTEKPMKEEILACLNF